MIVAEYVRRSRLPRRGLCSARRLPTGQALAASSQRGFFFSRNRPKLFNIDGLEVPHDFPRLADEAIKVASRELDGVAQKGPLDIVKALDNASNDLCRIADAAELCRNVHPDANFVNSANDCVQTISAFMGEVNLDGSVYEGMRHAETTQEFTEMTHESRTVLNHMRTSMEHEGIHLPDAEKAECLQLLEREQQLSFDIVQRQERLRRPGGDVNGAWIPLSGAQEALGNHVAQLQRRQSASSANKEEVLVPVDTMWADQIMKCAINPETRSIVYEAQQTSDDQGEADMAELLNVRQHLARLRGYKTWCDYAQRDALVQSPDRVASFLDAAWERLKPGVIEDLQLMASEKDKLGLGKPVLDPWDVPMLVHRCRQQHDKGSNVSEYLTYGSLMKGVDLILSKLLGLSFVAEKPGQGEVWHPSVQKYTLRDGDRVLGVLYMDPFSRSGKTVQSAQFTLQGSKHLASGDLQIPVTTLVYALPVGGNGMPLSYAITFMHEIGHAVHSLLSETTFQHLSGTRGTIDFVEFPSHLFEHFVLDMDCLGTYASHGKTGAPMPEDLRRDVHKGRQQFAHFEAAQQLMYAAVDQAFYSYVPPEGPDGPRQVYSHLSSVMDRFELDGPFNGPFTSLLGLSKPSKFDHLVHYGGSYYCYIFNRALSAHTWRHGFRGDPFGAEPGARLREMLRGGSVVQSLDVIADLCPGNGGFLAEDVPLDAFIGQLNGHM